MKRFFLVLTVMFWIGLKAQNVISTNAYVQTCIQKTNCFSENSSAFLFYDETRQEIILKIDFKKVKTGKDTLDDWMDDLAGSYFYFSGHLNKEDFHNLSNNNSRQLKMNGKILFNDIVQNTQTEITIFHASENSLMNRNTNDNNYDLYKITFGLSFMPKDFKIHKRPHHLKKSITIGIAAGRINQLKPEMEKLVEEVHRNR
jgi:hypothetical protein